MNDERKEDGPGNGVMREAGLVRPALGWAGWLGDRHLIAALAVAVPVWMALAATLGHRMAAPAGFAAWCGFVVLQPAVEEFAFRGVLQGWLLRHDAARRWGLVTRANVVTSLAFAALHLPWQSTGWALAVLVPSLVLGHLRERLGSVLPCFALHAVYNAGFALVAWSVHD